MKLVLFDIDGTLIYHVGQRKWEEQYVHGLRAVYGITDGNDFSKYNGMIEVQAAWDIVRKHGISRKDFLLKFPEYVLSMKEHLNGWAEKGEVFRVIPDAVSLVRLLEKSGVYTLGVLSGNAKSIADWKLRHTGLGGIFSFGLYGEEADNRNALAATVFTKAQKELQMTPAPSDILVIGDTVHDIRCGKTIGARTVAVTTGMHNDRAVLAAEVPDFLVDSLMSPELLRYFGVTPAV